MMYPEEIKYSEIASTDINLCLGLLEKTQDTKYSLDYLSKFDSIVLNNIVVLERTITTLKEILKNNPKYRFEYQDNELLKRIFNREINDDNLMTLRYLVNDLLDIEPAYGLSLSDWYFDKGGYERDNNVCTSVNNYANIYGIPSYVGTEYLNKDILTNQSNEVKRLLKCINRK